MEAGTLPLTELCNFGVLYGFAPEMLCPLLRARFSSIWVWLESDPALSSGALGKALKRAGPSFPVSEAGMVTTARTPGAVVTLPRRCGAEPPKHWYKKAGGGTTQGALTLCVRGECVNTLAVLTQSICVAVEERKPSTLHREGCHRRYSKREANTEPDVPCDSTRVKFKAAKLTG